MTIMCKSSVKYFSLSSFGGYIHTTVMAILYIVVNRYCDIDITNHNITKHLFLVLYDLQKLLTGRETVD